MDKIQKPGYSECYAPSSGPFRFYWEEEIFRFLMKLKRIECEGKKLM
jgi:hypothetical protein